MYSRQGLPLLTLLLLCLAAGAVAQGAKGPGSSPPPVATDSGAAPPAAPAAEPPASPAAPVPAPEGTQLPPAPPSGFGLAPGVGTPGGIPRLAYQGVGQTAYSAQPMAAPFDAYPLGCGLGFVSPTFQSNYVGVSPDIFKEATACGRCIMLQCDDASCSEPGRQLPAQVVDLCGSCTGLDLAISGPLFRNLTGREPAGNPAIVVSWKLTSCAPYTEGTIKMLLRSGAQAFYAAFGFSNSAEPIVAVQVNGSRLTLASDDYWQWNPGRPIDPTAPLDVLLAGATREVLRARVPSLRSADLGVQFKPEPAAAP